MKYSGCSTKVLVSDICLRSKTTDSMVLTGLRRWPSRTRKVSLSDLSSASSCAFVIVQHCLAFSHCAWKRGAAFTQLEAMKGTMSERNCLDKRGNRTNANGLQSAGN